MECGIVSCLGVGQYVQGHQPSSPTTLLLPCFILHSGLHIIYCVSGWHWGHMVFWLHIMHCFILLEVFFPLSLSIYSQHVMCHHPLLFQFLCVHAFHGNMQNHFHIVWGIGLFISMSFICCVFLRWCLKI